MKSICAHSCPPLLLYLLPLHFVYCELLYLILTRELGFYYNGSMFAKPEGNGLTKAKKKKRTKEEYLDMINELDTYLNKNNVNVIVEDFTIDNKNKTLKDYLSVEIKKGSIHSGGMLFDICVC